MFSVGYRDGMDQQPVVEYYGLGLEQERLAAGSSAVEFARTKELLERFLPPSPASVLDIGGGPGAYASWLADLGYRVHLIDPVPLHLEQATALARDRFTAARGDARELSQRDREWDAVLMLGPLYHLTERDQRLRALREARRVLRPGGLLAAAAISRFASLLHGLIHDALGDPAFDSIVERDLHEGQHRNPTDRPDWFTKAYFHHPDELRIEVDEAGLVLEGIFGIEGPGWVLGDRLDQSEVRERAVRVARAVEQEPTMLGSSGHLLVVARRPA